VEGRRVVGRPRRERAGTPAQQLRHVGADEPLAQWGSGNLESVERARAAYDRHQAIGA
jgi:hypothetical protein